jgi:hypothetical protein
MKRIGCNKMKCMIVTLLLICTVVIHNQIVFALNKDSEYIVNTSEQAKEIEGEMLGENSESHIERTDAISSPDNETIAEIVRKNNYKFDSVIINKPGKDLKEIVLENIVYTDINYTTWIDNNRFALSAHINPSLDVYVIINIEKGLIEAEYYGVGFTWDKNKNKLYYVQTTPYFSPDMVSDKITDNLGNIYYETEKNERMTDVLTISEDENKIAFFVNELNSNIRELVVLEKEQDKTFKKNVNKQAEFGEIEFNSDGSILIITDNN